MSGEARSACRHCAHFKPGDDNYQDACNEPSMKQRGSIGYDNWEEPFCPPSPDFYCSLFTPPLAAPSPGESGEPTP